MAVEFSGNWTDSAQQATTQAASTAEQTATETTTETQETQATTEEQQQANTQTQTAEITDESVLNYFKSKGREVSALDELFKAPEKVVEKVEVNPYEGVLGEKALQYLNYAKDTGGRSYEDFIELNKDYDAASPLELSIERARKDSGMNLSKDDAIAYLEKKLSVDLSDMENLDPADNVELNMYAKPFREEKKAEKEKYLQPIERNALPGVKMEDYEKMEDGSFIPKSILTQHQEQQRIQKEQFLQANTKSVDAVNESVFKVEVEYQGTKKTMELGYDFSAEDKQAMLSTTNDVSGHIEKMYRDENGGFKNAEFNENHGFWANKTLREKAFDSMVQKALATQLEDIRKRDNNVNFTREALPSGNVRTTAQLPGNSGGVGFGSNFLPQPKN